MPYPYPSVVNVEGIALPSTASTATRTSADLYNLYGRGGHVVLAASSVVTGGSVVVSIQGKDETSDAYYTLLTGATVSAAGTVVYKVYPGASAVANSVANDIIPTTWRVLVTHAVGTATYSVGYSLIE